ncbi:MAG: hypothetical protein WAL71_03900 [Terriglobales bacterium]|jgi:hypothetical protein
MNRTLIEYFRFPEQHGRLALDGPLSETRGYFRFGDETLFGRVQDQPAASPLGLGERQAAQPRIEDGVAYLPFDLTEVSNELRQEAYVNGNERRMMSAVNAAYYLVRPILPVAVRKHLQAIRLRNWKRLRFPHWPVDRTVDNLMEQALLLLLRAQDAKEIPFIWFWPDWASSAAVMTHDVETTAGRDFCPSLMDINESFGIPASFQVIPEERYEVTGEFLDSIRRRGFEVVVHDLNHDGRLFSDKKEFMKRVARINAYGKEFGATGFRAGVLYRNQRWFDALDFEYDSSVPNVAHLDPQRGGCCTVMPYFVGKMLELPVTMTQDYTLFHILNDYSTELWKRQTSLIMEKHGLMNVIIHPDYITGLRERKVYEALLAYLAEFRDKKNVWIATPGEVNRWWRQRARMKIVEENGSLRISGAGSDRASIAYATEQGGRLVYSAVASDALRCEAGGM